MSWSTRVIAALSVFLGIASCVCVSQSQPNDIASRFPMNATGILNGTLAVLPLPLSLVRSIVPAQYKILEDAYYNIMPNFPRGFYPALVQTMLDHDVRFGTFTLGDFQRASVEFPFIDLLGDGSTSFRYGPSLFITGTNAVAIGAIQAYGETPIPSSFYPPCDGYAQLGPGFLFTAAAASNTSTTSATLRCTPGQPCLSTYFVRQKGPVDADMMNYFINATNQPSFSKGDLCDNQIRLFNPKLAPGSSPFAPIPVVGNVYAVDALGVPQGKEGYVEDAPVQGVQAASRFIENNYIPCGNLRGYGAQTVQQLVGSGYPSF